MISKLRGCHYSFLLLSLELRVQFPSTKVLVYRLRHNSTSLNVTSPRYRVSNACRGTTRNAPWTELSKHRHKLRCMHCAPLCLTYYFSKNIRAHQRTIRARCSAIRIHAECHAGQCLLWTEHGQKCTPTSCTIVLGIDTSYSSKTILLKFSW